MPLAACVMFCAIESGYAGESNAGDGAYPADSTGNSVKTTTGVERSESLHVLDATPTDLRGIIETLRLRARVVGAPTGRILTR